MVGCGWGRYAPPPTTRGRYIINTIVFTHLSTKVHNYRCIVWGLSHRKKRETTLSED